MELWNGMLTWPTKWHKLTQLYPNPNFESLYIYYIPHDYTIPQVMPHSIPQTHCVFDPHHIIISMKNKTKQNRPLKVNKAGHIFWKSLSFKVYQSKNIPEGRIIVVVVL